MTRGRPLGSTVVTVDDINKIIELTKQGLSRPEIAKKVGFSVFTVYLYQKRYLG
jgi:hypothetical protein